MTKFFRICSTSVTFSDISRFVSWYKDLRHSSPFKGFLYRYQYFCKCYENVKCKVKAVNPKIKEVTSNHLNNILNIRQNTKKPDRSWKDLRIPRVNPKIEEPIMQQLTHVLNVWKITKNLMEAHISSKESQKSQKSHLEWMEW